jgi:hypothetical protein
MTRWPWITGVVAPIAAISPLGQEVLHGSFLSGEQLARSISQFLLTVAIASLAGLALLEWLVRMLLARRRATQAMHAPLTDAHSKTET